MKRTFLSSVLTLALLPALPWSCKKQQPVAATVPTPPPPVEAPVPTHLEEGDRLFREGDYARAAQAYDTYLRNNPYAPDSDRALFGLALTYASPESPVYNLPQALSHLRQLLNGYPHSPLRVGARMVLQLEEETSKLQSEIAVREQRITELTGQLKQMEHKDDGELEKLRVDIVEREERIRQLTAELDRLKQIDMQRRPTTNQ
jgi:hypothetical protein